MKNLCFQDFITQVRNGYQVIIRKNYRINGKKLETKNWVLTAYSKESSDTTQAPPGIN